MLPERLAPRIAAGTLDWTRLRIWRNRPVKEYDIILPLYYNDGTPIELAKYKELARELVERFEGATLFPNPNEGYRPNGEGLTQDKNVTFRVLSGNTRKAKNYLTKLKDRIKRDFRQEEVLIIQRDVEMV
jgi:hypothetical protein